jgi:hypothetical protein
MEQISLDSGWMTGGCQSEILRNRLDLCNPFVAYFATQAVSQYSLLGIESKTRRAWSYKTERLAISAPLLCIYWPKALLAFAKELIFLLPIVGSWETNVLVCIIYHHEGHVWVKQFQEPSCIVRLPFKIGKFYAKAKKEHHLMLL